jgi:hypothetical protein
MPVPHLSRLDGKSVCLPLCVCACATRQGLSARASVCLCKYVSALLVKTWLQERLFASVSMWVRYSSRLDCKSLCTRKCARVCVSVYVWMNAYSIKVRAFCACVFAYICMNECLYHQSTRLLLQIWLVSMWLHWTGNIKLVWSLSLPSLLQFRSHTHTHTHVRASCTHTINSQLN